MVKSETRTHGQFLKTQSVAQHCGLVAVKFYINCKKFNWLTCTDWSHMLCFLMITNMPFCLYKHANFELVWQMLSFKCCLCLKMCRSCRGGVCASRAIHDTCAWKLQCCCGEASLRALQQAKSRKNVTKIHPVWPCFNSQMEALCYHLYSFKQKAPQDLTALTELILSCPFSWGTLTQMHMFHLHIY